MAAIARPVSTDLENALATTVLDLRHGLLRGFLLATGLAHVGWYYFIAAKDDRFFFHTVVLILVAPLLWIIYHCYHRRYHLASYLLLLLIVLFQVLVAARYPTSLALCLGVLGIIAANALEGTGPALVVALVTWACGALISLLRGGNLPPATLVSILVLYLLIWAASWLANRPMRASVEWAITGWVQARMSLDEARARRAELYRALRALEEATHRVERMNHELLQARQEAELARAQKARFAATVSHELRGPLSLILGFTRLMARSSEQYDVPLPAAYAEDIETVYRNTQHLVALVDDVLDLAQVEAERLPLVKDRVNLAQDVVEKAIRIVQPLTERKGLYLRQECEDNLPWIIADQVRLRQALLNLLVNATRFTEQGGIVVRTTSQGDHLQVSVQDTGPGIPAEDIPRLFREFSQLQKPGETGGSGLGLNISKELVELHGGRIWVESTVGVGTTVHFTVPLPGASTAGEAFIRTADVQRAEREAECCLIVHDDPAIVRLLARYIEGYRVVGLPREEGVVDLTAALHPRAILTTPERAGRVREMLATVQAHVPIITCGMPRLREQNHLQGVLSYLIKPVLPEALASVMGQVEQNGETTVLLVDDEPAAVRLMENLLLALPRPYHILKAHSGREALSCMATITPDVVLLDLVMPEMTGEELLAQMRQDERLARVPVVIISARDWATDKVTVDSPVILDTHEPIEIVRAARCVGALMEIVSARYV